MTVPAKIFIMLGGLFFVGLAADLIGRRTPLPRVTLLLLFGVLLGPTTFDLLPNLGEEWFPLVTDTALVMVGFLLGGKLTIPELRQHGRLVLWLSVSVVLITAALMLAGLTLVGLPLEVALLLAGIATATAPTATMDVVSEARADGPFSRILLGVVAIDDAWGVIIFSVMIAVALAVSGMGGFAGIIAKCAWELGGAVLLGVGLGWPMAQLSGRIQPGEPTLAEALGMVFLCGGIALWLEVSFLLASMVMGMVVTNLASHHRRPFHAIKGIEWPFMILFFVFAGAALRLEMLLSVGHICLAYLFLRIMGRLVGSWIGGYLCNSGRFVRNWMGLAMMPQAGVALGMALYASQRFPTLEDIILPVVIGATVAFEVLGPLFTRLALVRSGEVASNHK